MSPKIDHRPPSFATPAAVARTDAQLKFFRMETKDPKTFGAQCARKVFLVPPGVDVWDAEKAIDAGVYKWVSWRRDRTRNGRITSTENISKLINKFLRNMERTITCNEAIAGKKTTPDVVRMFPERVVASQFVRFVSVRLYDALFLSLYLPGYMAYLSGYTTEDVSKLIYFVNLELTTVAEKEASPARQVLSQYEKK